MSFFDEVYKTCKKIPKGKVTTYGQIAFMLGKPRSARQVGWALHVCPDPKNIPWHRVLNRFGKLHQSDYPDNRNLQKELLEKEGIFVSTDYKVDIKKYLWNP